VTLVGGTVLKTILVEELRTIVTSPGVIFQILGCQVPVVAVYFIQLIVTKVLSTAAHDAQRTRWCYTDKRRALLGGPGTDARPDVTPPGPR
jgi:hypothetical protein